jgi:hypothetical protein
MYRDMRASHVVFATGAAAVLAAAAMLFIPINSARADSTPAVPTTDIQQVIDQARIDAAMTRMRERQLARGSAPATAPTTAPTTPPTTAPARLAAAAAPAPATQPATQPAADPYSREAVTARKMEMVQSYDLRIAQARMALRRRQIDPADVRDLANEQAALQHMSVDRFRQLLIEADERNAQRVERYRRFFGELDGAAKTVITILMKAGLIDSAMKLPDDPLTEDLELARGVRRVYFTFIMPSREGPPRRHNGYVEFLLAQTPQELWLPTWADLEGVPIPLFDAQAFFPLRAYRIVFDGQGFLVAQDTEMRQTPLFSLLSPPPPPIMEMQYGPMRRRADRGERAWNNVFAAPRLP